MPQVVLHRRAARYFERLDERLKQQLRARLEALGRDPSAMPGVKPMQGEWKGFYRLRHGDLRIIYLVDRASDTVVVAHLGPRGDVYK
ncbi:MAG TPA: type II toxin-antitoxin system RelE/ParE family toxin [Lacipirellulaceae bacterium]|nr:type II toxin-antitoxin system RelE/ParE family toxin [Lacipirellulaceae bacterium]HMP08031.1 type II toxin-antitoxin system RelE/ParE family toxin [Lacipirellulaceae bacterium]